MTSRQVVANSLIYDFVPDDEPLLATRDWAIGVAQLVDDVVGGPITARFTVRVMLPGIQEEINQAGARVTRRERHVLVKTGPEGTFALVAQPWLRFPPFGGATTVTVLVEADDFEPATVVFPITYDQRLVTAAAASGDMVVNLNSTAGIVTGQRLLLGPESQPQYLRVSAVAAAQVTLAGGLSTSQVIGDPVFPDTFTTPPPVIVALRRRPVTILGRVVTRNTTANVSTPVANASITVTDFWRTRAAVVANPSNGAMTDPVPALRQFAVAVTPGVLARRPVGAGVGPVTLPDAIDDRSLARPARAGQTVVNVDRRENLLPSPAPLPNRLVLIDAGDPAGSEYHTVFTIAPPGSPQEPARVEFDLPLALDHAGGARVSRLNPGALPAATATLMTAAERGDRCLFIDTPIASPPPVTLRITGGAAADEFQTFAPLSVRSDAQGYFRLPPIHRVARIAVTVDDGAGNVLPPVEIDPEYGQPEQRIDAVYLV